MNSVWYWIIGVFVLTILNVIGYSFGVKCSNANKYNPKEKTYMSILLGLNVIVMVIALAVGVWLITHPDQKLSDTVKGTVNKVG